MSLIQLNIESMKTYFIGILISIITFFTPITGFLVLMGVMVSADTLFAMYVAYKMGDGMKSLTSSKFFNIAPKLFFYLGTIMIAFMVDYFIFGTDYLFGIKMLGTKVISFAFISNEIKSINETYVKRFNKSIYDTLKEYYAVVKDLKKDIQELINNKEE